MYLPCSKGNSEVSGKGWYFLCTVWRGWIHFNLWGIFQGSRSHSYRKIKAKHPWPWYGARFFRGTALCIHFPGNLLWYTGCGQNDEELFAESRWFTLSGQRRKPGRNLYWKLSVNGTYIRKLHKIKCNGQKSAIDTFLPVYGIWVRYFFGRLLYIEIRLGGARST